ncbi:hypothetical protein RRF57_008590 [Xylaria bambusicola]|uniref:Uncharacterized protein n=1 Tax=Xylaria bambusicola TaxID=326684 RepID=A0AAN7UVK1_9PEZI
MASTSNGGHSTSPSKDARTTELGEWSALESISNGKLLTPYLRTFDEYTSICAGAGPVPCFKVGVSLTLLENETYASYADVPGSPMSAGLAE